MWMLLQHPIPTDILICSGKSVKLKDIITHIFDRLNISKDKLIIDPELFRPVDIIDSFGDNYNARQILGWNYDLNFFDVLDKLLSEELTINGI